MGGGAAPFSSMVHWPLGLEGKGGRRSKQGFVWPGSMTEIASQDTAAVRQLNFIPEGEEM